MRVPVVPVADHNGPRIVVTGAESSQEANPMRASRHLWPVLVVTFQRWSVEPVARSGIKG